MNYKELKRAKEKPVGKASNEWSSFPLWFASHQEIIDEASEFSVIDDFMSDNDMESFEDEFDETFPAYEAFAACDVNYALEKNPSFVFDSYAEFFLVVDKEDDQQRVLLWTGESQFEQLFDSFEAFWESLADWSV